MITLYWHSKNFRLNHEISDDIGFISRTVYITCTTEWQLKWGIRVKTFPDVYLNVYNVLCLKFLILVLLNNPVCHVLPRDCFQTKFTKISWVTSLLLSLCRFGTFFLSPKELFLSSPYFTKQRGVVKCK